MTHLTQPAPFPTELPATNIIDFQNNEVERKWNGTFTFIQGADTQFGMIDSYVLKKKESNWEKEMVLTTSAIQQINQMRPKPRFFVVCGDMLDSFPLEVDGQLATRKRQYADFPKVFKQLDPEIKLVCVCGNHDVGNDPTVETVANYRKEFGPDFFSFWVGGVKFVVLNSQYFKAGALVPEQVKAQENFMKTIPDPAAKHIVVFQHIPYFLNTCDDEPDYFTIDKPFRTQILDQLHSYGVRHIFCGHYHRNAGGVYKGIQQVVTSAIGAQLGEKDKSGYRVVTVEDSKISHVYVNIPEQTSTVQ